MSPTKKKKEEGAKSLDKDVQKKQKSLDKQKITHEKKQKKQKRLDKDMKNKKNKIKIDVEVEFTWVLLETKKIAYEKYLKNNDPGKIEN